MKKTLTLLYLILFNFIQAQTCSIDSTQNQVGIYPPILPIGHVGQTYSEDITFVLPTDTLGFDFINFQITAVTLPLGLTWSCNNVSNNCNYNPQINQHGCVNIQGTPLLAGSYTLDVSVLADLTILSGYPFIFQIELEILPQTTTLSNNGFSYSAASNCAPALISFNNNNPGLLAYQWDFANGNHSNLEQPSTQYYQDPGVYIVNYVAYNVLDTIEAFTLNQLEITNMTNYGGGFPSFDNADAYFKIKENGTLIYQSSIIGDQNPPVQWNLNLNLNANSNYLIEIWEADDSYGEPYFGSDDFIGSASLSLFGCSACSAGSGQMSYSVANQQILPSPALISIDTIILHEAPASPIISFDSINQTLQTTDMGYTYQWYFNGTPITGANSATHLILQSGVYSLIAINSNGCMAVSDTLPTTVLINNTSDTQMNSEEPILYPNPNNGSFHIQVPVFWLESTCTISNLSGQIIWEGVLPKELNQLDLQELTNGTYLLKLEKEKIKIHYRFVKNS
jgi:hypothetical protein